MLGVGVGVGVGGARHSPNGAPCVANYQGGRLVSYFAVIRDAGPAWTDGNGAFEQPGVDAHATFMNALADEGIVLFAGPLAGSEHGRIRVLLIVDTDSEATILDRLAVDPWAQAQRLVTTSVEPWNLLIGAERISVASKTPT
jgi:uncharacterized protein YciI